jgi:lipocalin
MEEETYKKLLKKAEEKGFDTSKIIVTEQDCE